jgi:hypothetical protein
LLKSLENSAECLDMLLNSGIQGNQAFENMTPLAHLSPYE